ncbi:MAG: carbohydrate-binding protein [Fibrobacter sp.]|nr:carbohydrate-binding protein [Fibrobacter sp.]
MVQKLFISLSLLLIMNFNLSAGFDPCKFNFGTDWDYLQNEQSGSVATEIDYVTKWLVNAKYSDNGVYGRMLDYCVKNKKTAVFYSYIIAKAAALGDADVGGKLNSLGAEWIRKNFNSVKNYYQDFAQNIASKVKGSGIETIWLLEPDYYQYASGPQAPSPLSFSQAGDYLGQLIDIIKQQLPDAKIAIDISPWIQDQGNTQSWYNAMPLNKVDFLFTSGGQSQAQSSTIKAENKMTWQGVSSATGKPVIADCGYGVGGGSTGHNAAWDDVNNLKARIADGIIAITQKNPNSSWGNTITTLRTQLAAQTIKSCGSVTTKFNLSISSVNGGNVTKDKEGTSFTKGTVITLIAKASDGFKFENWTGDANGTNETLKVTMDSDKTIKANFTQLPANSFTVTLNTSGSGTVSKSPDQQSYSSGTQITITATPINGVSIFEGWNGDYTGSEKSVSISVTTNLNITAKFRDTLTADSIKIEAENFSQKNGANLVVEDNGDIKNIGYIENGYSTTYSFNVTKSGEYRIVFRVATANDNGSFDISVDNNSSGTISFSNTGSWTTYKNESLSTNLNLSAGNHTLVLNFKNALNVDYMVLKLVKANSVKERKKSILQHTFRVTPVKSGFFATLPDNHRFNLYSLYDCKGQKISSGEIKPGVSIIKFDNLTNNIWILWLEGFHGNSAVRTATVR